MRRYNKVKEFCKGVMLNYGMSAVENTSKCADNSELQSAAIAFHNDLELIFMMNEFM
jgi:hypothetical protein